jgi:hypothetical protein
MHDAGRFYILAFYILNSLFRLVTLPWLYEKLPLVPWKPRSACLLTHLITRIAS